MTLAIDRRAYSSVQPPETRATRGIGLAVTNVKGELWIQRDMKSRERTNRKAGDLSIIFETEKAGEPLQSNVLGAISELTNDNTLHIVRNHLFTTDGLQSTPRLHATNEGRHIDYGIAVVVFDGDLDSMYGIQPHDADETTPVSWMSPKDFLTQQDVRPLARHAVEYLEADRTIDRKLGEFSTAINKALVLPNDFHVSEYHALREQTRDRAPVIMRPDINYAVT